MKTLNGLAKWTSLLPCLKDWHYILKDKITNRGEHFWGEKQMI